MNVLRIGSHTVTLEAPDFLHIRVCGALSPDEARALVRADRAVWMDAGYSLVLLDATEGTTFPAAARAASVEEVKLHPGYLGSTAVFGLSPYMRVLLNLMGNALRLLGTQDDELECFKDEEAARAFLALRRPLRQKQAAEKRT